MIRVVGRVSKTEKIDGKHSVAEIMDTYGISDERFIYLVNGTPVTKDFVVSPDEDLLFLEIFSGG
ncbi:MAG: ubiquitin family protein [Cuniculiplasma sp.]